MFVVTATFQSPKRLSYKELSRADSEASLVGTKIAETLKFESADARIDQDPDSNDILAGFSFEGKDVGEKQLSDVCSLYLADFGGRIPLKIKGVDCEKLPEMSPPDVPGEVLADSLSFANAIAPD